jgi:hypothetical protein
MTTHLLLVPRSRIRGAIPPPQYVFMAWYLVKYRDNFTLLYLTLHYFIIFLDYHSNSVPLLTTAFTGHSSSL